LKNNFENNEIVCDIATKNTLTLKNEKRKPHQKMRDWK
jgi:hypothetical protein